MCAHLHPSTCSSNTVFLSLPQPALPSALSYNPSACGGQTANSLDSNANVQNWIIKQVRPATYEDAKTSHETSDVPTIFHSAWSDSWVHQLLPNETPVTFQNQTKSNKSMQCEVCKIDCNSKSVFEKHISGKKHKRNMQLQNNCTDTVLSGTSYMSSQIQTRGVQGDDLFVAVGRGLESKKLKLLSGGGASVDSVQVCLVCNIACNSQEVLSTHLAGKKHAAKVHDLIFNKGISPKKIKVAQPAQCEVCNINCNSNDVYIAHLSGKKHMRNLEKLSKSDSNDAGSGATAAIPTANVLQHATNAVNGPQEKPDPSKQDEINSQKPGNAVMLEAPEKDFETSAASVKLCTLCNVVCNSETVYNSHLTGQKHAAMVKKQAGSTIS